LAGLGDSLAGLEQFGWVRTVWHFRKKFGFLRTEFAFLGQSSALLGRSLASLGRILALL